jgi:2-dehydropantoate 2-reductase
MRLRVGDAEFSAGVNASGDPAALGAQDVVISTLKATGLGSLATGLPQLLRDDTAIVFAQNGIRGGTTSGCRRIIRRLRT